MSNSLAEKDVLTIPAIEPELASSGKSDGKSNGKAITKFSEPPQVRISPRKWLAVACLCLFLSAGFRFLRDSQFNNISGESANCPFPLDDLPDVVGTWAVVPGVAKTLDPETVQIAGATEYIIRDYKDSTTGDEVSILVLYGLASTVFSHTPEACYPAQGYRSSSDRPPTDRQVPNPGSASPIRYRSSYFVKNAAYTEVLSTFRHNGDWIPEASGRWKMFRRSPGMFRILIQRPTTGISADESPCESLLLGFVREIDKRLAERKGLALN